ncbi:D-ribose pyranase [Cellulomonas sp. P24]|uniref:D-ribose pyranase n=1 Tax=Cellulomonas sp. P24 TaxID=2885206 RepID=UPI00216B2476|nr:D-ribose pyranase [Cellulomonas sp. P24]MCR6493593.1 D-ribose pyranase [Cellulomonas sp. P24]
MKKSGILNSALSGALAELGHTHRVVVADCGMPRPHGVPVVDLALTFGIPSFEQVIAVLAQELVVEHVTAAREATTTNPAVLALLTDHFGVPRLMSHEELKAESATAQLFVRTGEATAHANAILHCGVPF